MFEPDATINGLKDTLTVWESIDHVGTAIVIAGVVGEFVAEFIPRAEKLAKKIRLSMVSTLVLVLGLALELTAVIKTQRLSAELLGQLEQKAAAAMLDADSARTTALGYEAQIAKANENAKAAELKTAIVEADAADAKRETARLTIGVEQEKAARLKIEQKVADRAITDTGAIVSAAVPYKFQNFRVLTYPDSPEPKGLHDQIVRILLAATWEYFANTNNETLAPNETGVVLHLGLNADVRTQRAAMSLSSALTKAGVPSSVNFGGQMSPKNLIVIGVGTKQ